METIRIPRRIQTSNERLDEPQASWQPRNCDFVNNSTVSNDSLSEHPFIACFIDGVPVNALLGSMKSFISDKVHDIPDFDCDRLDKSQSQSQRFTSITGRDLNIAETLSTTFGKIPIHSEHPAINVQSNGVVIIQRLKRG